MVPTDESEDSSFLMDEAPLNFIDHSVLFKMKYDKNNNQIMGWDQIFA